MIKVDISNVWGQVSLPDLLALEKEVFDAHMTLSERNGAGNDFLGWLDLPVREPTEEIIRIQKAAEKIRSESEVCVVVGIGGMHIIHIGKFELVKQSFRYGHLKGQID